MFGLTVPGRRHGYECRRDSILAEPEEEADCCETGVGGERCKAYADDSPDYARDIRGEGRGWREEGYMEKPTNLGRGGLLVR